MNKTRYIFAAICILALAGSALAVGMALRPQTVIERQVVVVTATPEPTKMATATKVVQPTISPTNTSKPDTATPASTSTSAPAPASTKTSKPNAVVPAGNAVNILRPRIAPTYPITPTAFQKIEWDCWANIQADGTNIKSFSVSGGVNSAKVNGQEVSLFDLWIDGVWQGQVGLGAWTSVSFAPRNDTHVCVTSGDAVSCIDHFIRVDGGGSVPPTPPTPPPMPTHE